MDEEREKALSRESMCEHMDDGLQLYFANGMCRGCFEKFVQVSGKREVGRKA